MTIKTKPEGQQAPQRPAFAGWLKTTNAVTNTFLSAGRIPDLINMAGGLPEPASFPVVELADLAREAVEQHPQEVLGYGPVEGLPELREALAKRFSTPDLALTAANVLITTSGMQGLDLIGKTLLEPGELIAGQFPTYLGAIDAWRPRAPSFRNLFLDAAGFNPHGALEGAQFAYTVPNFSNPTGKMVGIAMRQALVEEAHRTGVWLVEDDPYSTLLYDGEALPRLIDLSARMTPGQPYEGPVAYMGTLSKQIAPGLRIGWVVAAPAMIAALTMAKQGSDMCTSGLTQRIALAALQSGLVDQLQPEILEIYRPRRDALLAAMAEYLTDWFEWEKPVGGMFIWATARDPALNTDLLLQHAMAARVCIAPSSVFDASGQYRRAIRLNFTLNNPERLREGMRRLADALMTMQAKRIERT